jgi:hypothetical protein
MSVEVCRCRARTPDLTQLRHTRVRIGFGPCHWSLLWLAGVVSALLVAVSGSVSAQVLDQYFPAVTLGDEAFRLDTVLSRNRSEFDNKGIQLGSVVIRPHLEESFGFDDNILSNRSRLSSEEVDTRAAIGAATDWSRNALFANITVDEVRYLAQPAQSYTDWTASIGGTYEIWRDKASLTYSHASLSLQPGAIDNLVAGVPVPYTVDDLHLGYLADFGRVSLQPEFGFTRYRFDAVVVNGVSAGSQSGDRDVGSGSVTAAYEFDTSRKIVLAFRSSYSAFVTGNGMPLRNNTGLTALAGIDYTANGLVRYRVLLGYAQRIYDSSAYRTITAPVAEGSVIWSPERVTTVTATVNRRIEDAIDASVVGYTYTQAELTVDHEMRRDLLLQFRTSAQIADYSQNAGTQTIYTVGGRIEWYLNRVARLTGDYTFSVGRNPDTDTGNTALVGGYTRNVFMLGVRLQL